MGAFTIASISTLPDLAAMAAESEAEGYAFVQKMIKRWESGENRFDKNGEIFYAAYDAEGRVIGMCGRNVDPYADDPRIARVRHLYVMPSVRGTGLGGELMRRILSLPQGQFTALRVRIPSANPAAAGFYERHGFKPVNEPDASHRLDF